MYDIAQNKLTEEIVANLEQGTKVKFKRYSSSIEYIGRIEINKYGEKFFINEHNFKDNVLIYEGMRYYNRLEITDYYTYFEIIE